MTSLLALVAIFSPRAPYTQRGDKLHAKMGVLQVKRVFVVASLWNWTDSVFYTHDTGIAQHTQSAKPETCQELAQGLDYLGNSYVTASMYLL